MEELINNNIQYCTNFVKSLNYINYIDKNIIREYHKKNPDASVNYILVDLLVNSTNLELKGFIAAYFHNYIYGNLRGDSGERRLSQLESIYNKIHLIKKN
jgi:hypothetical protein